MLLGILAIAGTIAVILANTIDSWKDRHNEVRFGIAAPAVMVALLGWFFLIGSSMGSISENGKLMAARCNLPNLKEAAIKLNAIAVVAQSSSDPMINLDNMKQSTNASEAVKAYVTAVNDYNSIIASRTTWSHSIWLYGALPPLPPGTEMVTVDLETK